MAHECCRCKYFHGFYSKTYCGFYMEKFGMCYKHDKIYGKHDNCEDFALKTVKRDIKAGVVINALSDAITDINTIKNILEERNLK